MSAPTLDIEDDGKKVSGNGLGLAGVSIEQDAAYWEWHITIQGKKYDDNDSSTMNDVKFGVSTKKDRSFYRNLDEQDDVSPATDGTALMKSITDGLRDGDVVGVAVQQSDLPMIQFLVNGEPYHELAINRFRGTVYPSIQLPPLSPESRITAELVFEEEDFQEESPHARFGPVIVARGII
eukprot:CAMPEP_0194139210 /NCGR_PEP_ID=MMETSP0152-20130528/8923_1 /TAXON_ID=1049557 /ORGANISM="Thalassiothrix antarctica, Strain L6-D1" /LENGTH=179 /DNA_ID=CAMNT_0038836987 /DNA_START=262 /DNA_END=801 /DNA_ORIENTATION=+